MTFFRITRPHPYLTEIGRWYEAAFPSEERRTVDDLVALLPCPDMHLCALMSQQQPVGFMIYWQWLDIDVLFIEHFAIDPAQRGIGLGQQAMTQVLSRKSTQYLLEAELPTDPIRRRRIHFYERQGFHAIPFAYMQPPYQPGNVPIPMQLLANPSLSDPAVFATFRTLIHERVYQRFYRPF